ncbi:MAG: chromophore lyase CpcT/CpeT [Timaviella obliquedivisa GSE-PSE-MK23-08B]|jgi:hypothetical protein|nr:chromophore lyase CpcT/CpeT [Timaviella obliquedivisa GSE-PSE-MK23-08B]
MSSSQNLTALAQLIAGEFDNKLQAMEQPTWFVHLRLWYRPLPMRIEGNLALFAEQANALTCDRPYRQRVAVLVASSDSLQVQYLALKQPEKFLGAGANPSLLESLSLDDLETLPGCELTVTEQAGRFKAVPPPGAKCYFQYDGATRQVVLGFEVSPGKFWSYDRGVEPDTGQGLWGALMGAYEFQKCEDFAKELLI